MSEQREGHPLRVVDSGAVDGGLRASRSNVMPIGTVKWFDSKKGFGFIVNADGKDVFVHFSVIEGDGFRSLREGEPVEYEQIEGDKGLHAKSVKRLAPVEKGAKLKTQV